MKELSTEQKAEAYDVILEKARSWYIDCQLDFKKALEELFPELKESNDERIRKELIKSISKTRPNTPFLDTNVTREDALAWLEKQGNTTK